MAVTRSKTRTLLDQLVERLQAGEALLPDTPENLEEVVGILQSYGVVLDAYYRNLLDIAERQFLVLFPFFKYFDGHVTLERLLKHWWHDRINYEYAEYTLRTMMWHGGGGLETYLESEQFIALAHLAIAQKIRLNPGMRLLEGLFPDFLLEQVRQAVYYHVLGQFWQVMSPLFLTLAEAYERGEVRSIPEVVDHVKAGLVAAASQPLVYQVTLDGATYDIIPASAGLTFLADAAIPYVEAIFFRGTPFFGVVSYNAQLQEISNDPSRFTYGALYADPVTTGGAGIPPTLLMQDMRHYLPPYLRQRYLSQTRGEADLRVKICISFQKSMFCVTTATILGLLPYPLDTANPEQRQANHLHLRQWVYRLQDSQVLTWQWV